MSPCGEPESPCCPILPCPGSTTAQFLILLDFGIHACPQQSGDMFIEVVCLLGFPPEHGVHN